MNISSVSQTGIAAIQSGLTKLNRSTDTIVKASINSGENGADRENTPDLIQGLVDAKEAKSEIQVGAKIVEAYDEVLGTLLDVTA